MTFAIAALVLIMMPGPDQALITRNALVGGRQGGLLTTCGGALGLTVHAGAAAVGLSALLVASATAFTVLKVVGAVYLVWLAVQMVRSAARTLRAPEVPSTADVSRSRIAYLGQGFLSNALNPKVALFFVTFLPQFLSPGSAAPAAQALMLSGVFACLYLAWFGAYVAAVDRLGRWLRRPSIQAGVERITGVVLLAVAARLVTSHQ